MGRYGPPAYTEDRSGELLANAISGAFDSYQQQRRIRQFEVERKADRERAAEDRARAQRGMDLADAVALAGARRAGIMPGTAPVEDLTVQLPDPEAISTTLGSGFGRPGAGGGLAGELAGDFQKFNHMGTAMNGGGLDVRASMPAALTTPFQHSGIRSLEFT